MNNPDHGTCYACGEGRFEPLATAGRQIIWEMGLTLSVPEDLAIPTCTSCGEMAFSAPLMDALSAAFLQQRNARAHLAAYRVPANSSRPNPVPRARLAAGFDQLPTITNSRETLRAWSGLQVRTPVPPAHHPAVLP